MKNTNGKNKYREFTTETNELVKPNKNNYLPEICKEIEQHEIYNGTWKTETNTFKARL